MAEQSSLVWGDDGRPASAEQAGVTTPIADVTPGPEGYVARVIGGVVTWVDPTTLPGAGGGGGTTTIVAYSPVAGWGGGGTGFLTSGIPYYGGG